MGSMRSSESKVVTVGLDKEDIGLSRSASACFSGVFHSALLCADCFDWRGGGREVDGAIIILTQDIKSADFYSGVICVVIEVAPLVPVGFSVGVYGVLFGGDNNEESYTYPYGPYCSFNGL